MLGSQGPHQTFSGTQTFLRRKATQDVSGADVVVSGLPFDLATTFRPGARFGPQAIRAASVQLAELLPHAYPFNFNPFDELAVADWGDVEFVSGYPDQAVAVIEAHARALLAQDVTMLTFGGDHFVTYPLLKAHAEKFGKLSLVHFDAHVDTWPDDGKRLDHGSMFLRALNEGLIDPGTSVQ
ncbi:MAG: arginase family protein, partial [Pseudomonadales bacterium]